VLVLFVEIVFPVFVPAYKFTCESNASVSTLCGQDICVRALEKVASTECSSWIIGFDGYPHRIVGVLSAALLGIFSLGFLIYLCMYCNDVHQPPFQHQNSIGFYVSCWYFVALVINFFFLLFYYFYFEYSNGVSSYLLKSLVTQVVLLVLVFLDTIKRYRSDRGISTYGIDIEQFNEKIVFLQTRDQDMTVSALITELEHTRDRYAQERDASAQLALDVQGSRYHPVGSVESKDHDSAD
jgi:hypothetical protein